MVRIIHLSDSYASLANADVHVNTIDILAQKRALASSD